ncbi:MAG TPA: hypothetical protein PK781_02960 [Terrimesophilobacter sp.]|nr:hypothetical protein [Terrimesophilobacter sp.]HRP99406.1 hypothetical protein [Terrimesophilobacter sp.]
MKRVPHGVQVAEGGKEVGGGTTGKEAYVLRDDSPVTVEVRELIDFTNTVLATQDFTVSG